MSPSSAFALFTCFLASLTGISSGLEAIQIHPVDTYPYNPYYSHFLNYYPTEHLLAGQLQRQSLQGM